MRPHLDTHLALPHTYYDVMMPGLPLTFEHDDHSEEGYRASLCDLDGPGILMSSLHLVVFR